MDFVEWQSYPRNDDAKSSLCPGYILSETARFIMEPGFYSQLSNVKALFPDQYNDVINAINERVKKNHKVYFTVNIDAPFVDLKDYIYLEITDILDPLKIFPEDKSRGSDYGD